MSANACKPMGERYDHRSLSLGERVARCRRFHQSVSRRSRVRGYFDGPTQVFAAVRSAVILCPCASQPRASANCGAAKLTLKKQHGICCAAENWARSFAANAASKTGSSISTVSSIAWRSSLMVCSLAAQPNAERRYERRLFEKSRHRLAADSERVGAGRSGGVRAQGAGSYRGDDGSGGAEMTK